MVHKVSDKQLVILLTIALNIFNKLFNTDGTDWKENTCLIFHNIEDRQNRVIEFYENTSKFALTNNGGFKFDYLPVDTEAKTILSSIIQRDKEIKQNNESIWLYAFDKPE